MKITVGMLIYANPAYLINCLKSLDAHPNEGIEQDYLVVANDPWPAVYEYLKSKEYDSFCKSLKGNVKTVIHHNEPLDPYWIQNVYGGWNRVLSECTNDYIAFVNSDMLFTDNWLSELAKYPKYDYNKIIPTSRLVEGGRMPSLPGLISKNFGQSLAELDVDGFEKYAKEISESRSFTWDIGAFMPSLFKADVLRSIGGWHKNQNGVPGDQITMFLLNRNLGMRRIMCHDSIVYHWQRGESAESGDLK